MWWAVCRFLITRRLHYWPNVRRREMQWLNKRVYIIEGENSARAAFCCLSNYTLGNSQKSLPLPSPQTHMLAATHAAVIPPLLSCDALLKCYLFFSLKANFIYVSLVHVTFLIPMHFCPVANKLLLGICLRTRCEIFWAQINVLLLQEDWGEDDREPRDI